MTNRSTDWQTPAQALDEYARDQNQVRETVTFSRIIAPFPHPPADMFLELIPKRPYCADVLEDGVSIREREDAIRRMHIQLNGPAFFRWMVHDIDRPDAYFAHRDALVAEPTFIAVNRANGHAHAATLLALPVYRRQMARAEPLEYFAAVERGYARRLGADQRYAGLLAKNPMHPAWRVEWRNAKPATLNELQSWLYPEDMLPETTRFATTGAGRNCSIFDDLRALAYREVIRFKKAGRAEQEFRDALQKTAQGWNQQFALPLSRTEIRAIAKSVANWTWKRFTLEKYEERSFVNRDWQSWRGRRGMAKRWAGHVALDKTRPWIADGISRATWFRRKGQRPDS
jgi:hypothetical protein